MTTAIDTNIIVALWDADLDVSLAAQAALEAAFSRGNLIVAAPGSSETFVAAFLEDAGIAVDWDLSEAVWRATGRAFHGYADRRRKHRESGVRRILADFF